MSLSDFLLSVPEMARIPYDELLRLEKAMPVRDYPDDHEFIREGRKGDDIFLIVSGEVSVTHRSPAGAAPLEVKRLKPGEFFGLVALIDHGRRAASCRAVGPVRVASLPRSAFELLYHSESKLSHDFLSIIAHQLMRDYRALTHVVKQAMFQQDESAMDEDTRALVEQYAGPERRRAERRGVVAPERRQRLRPH